MRSGRAPRADATLALERDKFNKLITLMTLIILITLTLLIILMTLKVLIILEL